jgi:hypothetical protein
MKENIARLRKMPVKRHVMLLVNAEKILKVIYVLTVIAVADQLATVVTTRVPRLRILL